MRCEEIRENLLDYAAGLAAKRTGPFAAHVKECENCAAQLSSLRQTMAVLDELQAPEPSAYFDIRLKARLREEAAHSRTGWREQFASMFRKVRVPVLTAALGMALITGVTMYHSVDVGRPSGTGKQASAVKDLQTLDSNYDLIQDLDTLDNSASQVNDTGL